MQLVTSKTVTATAFQKSVARQLVSNIKSWTLDEVLTQTERLRADLGLNESRLVAAICGESDVVVMIDGGTFDSKAADELREKMAQESGGIRNVTFKAVVGDDIRDELRESFFNGVSKDRLAEITRNVLSQMTSPPDPFLAIFSEKCRDASGDQPAPAPETPPHSADSFLSRGIGHMQDRADQYDAPSGERSMEATVAAFNAIAGTDLCEAEGWTFMQVLKIVRANQGGKFKADHYEDLAAYAGLCGEAKAEQQRRVDAAGKEGSAQ